MSFDIEVTREARHTRVAIKGEASLGRLLSLLQVLRVDSPHWPPDEVVFDLDGIDVPLTAEELAHLREEASRLLPWFARITVPGG